MGFGNGEKRMTGWSTCRKPNGIRLYIPLEEAKREPESPRSVIVFLDQDECKELAKSIWRAQREYWKEEKKIGRAHV